MDDVIVVGAGIAGMRAALAARQHGASVRVITRTNPTRSYSITIQDGINAAIGAGDSPEQHAADTLAAGTALVSKTAVEAMCREAPATVRELDSLGMPFNRGDDSEPALAQLRGSSRARALFADDMTGHVLTQVLYEQLLKSGIPTLEEWAVVGLVVDGSSCRGVVTMELSSGRLELLPSKAVILATGGPRRLYDPSTASLLCSGDGLAMAYRAGASLVDMEMVQYHPYVVAGTRLALSELLAISPDQVRGGSPLEDGAASPAAAARALGDETGTIDLTEDQRIKRPLFFNTRHRISGLAAIDVTKAPVPVRPAMHRLLGGIAVDEGGATAVQGLYATGECAGTGIHGACGLDGNFLLASLVTAKAAGAAAATLSRSTTGAEPSTAALEDVRRSFAAAAERPGNGAVASLRQELAGVMHREVGLVRHAAGLQHAREQVQAIAERYTATGAGSMPGGYNQGMLTYLELGYLLDLAQAIIASAEARQESRGVHFRSDYPAQDDASWTKRLVVSRASKGPAIDFIAAVR